MFNKCVIKEQICTQEKVYKESNPRSRCLRQARYIPVVPASLSTVLSFTPKRLGMDSKLHGHCL